VIPAIPPLEPRLDFASLGAARVQRHEDGELGLRRGRPRRILHIDEAEVEAERQRERDTEHDYAEKRRKRRAQELAAGHAQRPPLSPHPRAHAATALSLSTLPEAMVTTRGSS
jgi:hypothetical protein